jgi:hypothetical protein
MASLRSFYDVLKTLLPLVVGAKISLAATGFAAALLVASPAHVAAADALSGASPAGASKDAPSWFNSFINSKPSEEAASSVLPEASCIPLYLLLTGPRIIETILVVYFFRTTAS